MPKTTASQLKLQLINFKDISFIKSANINDFFSRNLQTSPKNLKTQALCVITDAKN